MSGPDPLTPRDCDLRGMPYMELDVVRLLDSDFFAMSTGDEFKAGVALWGKSWNQIPAASLPVNDRVLSHLAGVSPKEWAKLKTMALHGWVECSDGRLYHPIVAEKALAAWQRRQAHREDKSTEAERKAQERQDRKDMFSAIRAAGLTMPTDVKTKELRAFVADRGLIVVWTKDKPPADPARDESRAQSDTSRDMSQDGCDLSHDVTPMRGNGNGRGNSKEEESFALVVSAEPKPTPAVEQAFADYNAMAARSGLPAARSLTKDRRAHIAARLREHGLDGWREALAKMEASPHCLGQNDRGWKADLDFLFQAKSWNRLLEGSYDHRPANDTGPGGKRAWDPIEQAFAGIEWPTEPEEAA